MVGPLFSTIRSIIKIPIKFIAKTQYCRSICAHKYGRLVGIKKKRYVHIFQGKKVRTYVHKQAGLTTSFYFLFLSHSDKKPNCPY